MRTASFLIMGALGISCASQPAQPVVAANQSPTDEPAARGELDEVQGRDQGRSGDPNLGNLSLADAPAAPRAEAPQEAGGTSASPRAIEPAAPTVATTPPGSALTPPPPEAAGKDEAELRSRIQSTLLRNPSLSFTAKRVRVEVERGRVTLLGEVRTAREKSEVEELVERVSGVKRVTNRLAVIDQPAFPTSTP
jgi:hypothetical protein